MRALLWISCIATFIAAALCAYSYRIWETRHPSLSGFPRIGIAPISHRGTLIGHSSEQANHVQNARDKVDSHSAGPNSIRDELNRLYAHRQFAALQEALRELAKRDPRSALALAETLPHPASSYAAMFVLKEWLDGNPDAAWAYIVVNAPGLAREPSFVLSLAQSGRYDLATDAINRTTDLSSRKLLAKTLFEQWAANDPEALAAYAKTLPAEVPPMAQAALAAQYLASGNLTQAQLEKMLGTSGTQLNDTWGYFATNLVDLYGYAKAKEVFSSIEQPDGSSGGAYAVLAYSAPGNEATMWLNAIADQQARQSAEISVANHLASIGDYENAANVALTSPNQTVRDTQISRILISWADLDPAAVTQYVTNTTSLDTKIRTAVLAAVGTTKP